MSRILLAAALLAALPAAAEQPLAPPGDAQLRQDVELLKAARLIRGPVSSWPVPWSQIVEGVEAAEAPGPVSPPVRAAAARLRRHLTMAEARTVYDVRAAGTNRPALIRGFAETAREQADVSARVTHNLGRLSVTYGAGYRYEQRGRDYHFEPGQATLALGNWAVYGGYVEKYWGPGNDGALTIGNSARPFPKLGVTRLYPYKPEPKFLRWIGPWRFDFFGGVLDDDRNDSDNPIQFGMQFNFEPAPGLEFNLNRMLLVCGGTRSSDTPNPTGGGVCNAASVTRSLFPFFGGVQPGDSLAGFAVSYTRMIGPVAVKAYYDVAGEDKDSFQQFDQVGQLGGASLTGPLGGEGATWQLVGEYTDTLANFWFTGRDVPGSFYNNTFYFDGKVYQGDAIGHTIDGDSTLLTVAGAVTDTRNRRWYGSYRHADLYKTEFPNAAGRPANRVSLNRERINIGTAGVDWPTVFGDVRLEARVMDDKPNSRGRMPGSGEVEVGWRTRF